MIYHIVYFLRFNIYKMNFGIDFLLNITELCNLLHQENPKKLVIIYLTLNSTNSLFSSALQYTPIQSK